MQTTEAVKEAAEKHSRQIGRLSSTLTRAKLENMPAAAELASEIRAELASVKPDSAAVLAETPGWPAVRHSSALLSTQNFWIFI